LQLDLHPPRADGQRVGAEQIGEGEAELGDICLDGERLPCVAYRHREGISLSRYEGGWRRTQVVARKELKWPIMACDQAGLLHLVWTDNQGLLYYLRSKDGERWTGADGKSSSPDFIGGYCHEAPSLAAAGEQVMVVHYQGYRVLTYSHYDGQQ